MRVTALIAMVVLVGCGPDPALIEANRERDELKAAFKAARAELRALKDQLAEEQELRLRNAANHQAQFAHWERSSRQRKADKDRLLERLRRALDEIKRLKAR